MLISLIFRREHRQQQLVGALIPDCIIYCLQIPVQSPVDMVEPDPKSTSYEGIHQPGACVTGNNCTFKESMNTKTTEKHTSDALKDFCITELKAIHFIHFKYTLTLILKYYEVCC